MGEPIHSEKGHTNITYTYVHREEKMPREETGRKQKCFVRGLAGKLSIVTNSVSSFK